MQIFTSLCTYKDLELCDLRTHHFQDQSSFFWYNFLTLLSKCRTVTSGHLRCSTAHFQMAETQVCSHPTSYVFMSADICSYDKSQSMVSERRSSVYYHVLLHGSRHDSWHRLSLLWSRSTEVCTFYDLGSTWVLLHCHHTMVFLGLLVSIFDERDIGVYWGLGTLGLDEDARESVTWKSSDPRTALRLLSGTSTTIAFLAHILTSRVDDVRCHYRSYCDWGYR